MVAARGFGDADDIAAVFHHRVAKATARPAGSGRARKAPRLIVGLIPEATGTMTTDMRRALTERRGLLEARADAILDQALNDGEPWTAVLGNPPKDERATVTWRRHARTVAAYRDRYSITGPAPLGAPAESTTQKIDAARARTALDRARDLSHDRETMTPERPATPEAAGGHSDPDPFQVSPPSRTVEGEAAFSSTMAPSRAGRNRPLSDALSRSTSVR